MGAMLSCHTVFRVSLEIGSVGPSALLFQIVFVLLGFFCSHVDNRISSLASTFFFFAVSLILITLNAQIKFRKLAS